MKGMSKYILFHFIFLFWFNLVSCQVWNKQSLEGKADSLYAIYVWEASDEYHTASGKLILERNGRFTYSAYYPLNQHEYSDGNFIIKDNILTVTSDFQSANLKANIKYIDRAISDLAACRLSYPINQNGDTLYFINYRLNNDSTIFDLIDVCDNNLVNSIRRLRVDFWDNHFGTDWIPIENNSKFIQVTILTDKNLNDYHPKILNWKFKIDGNRLMDISEKKIITEFFINPDHSLQTLIRN